jgi:DNA-binding PadR family transcriptional regulator
MYRRLLLLGLLHQKEMHGYRLNEFIDRMLGICSDLKRSTAYFLLGKLSQEGYVTESTVREGNYPERKVYSMTPSGEEYFLSLLRENLGGYQRALYSDDMGLAFLHELPEGERRPLLEARRARMAAELAELERIPPHGGTIDLIIDRNKTLLRAEIEWLDRSMDRAAAIEGLYQWDDVLAGRHHTHAEQE